MKKNLNKVISLMMLCAPFTNGLGAYNKVEMDDVELDYSTLDYSTDDTFDDEDLPKRKKDLDMASQVINYNYGKKKKKMGKALFVAGGVTGLAALVASIIYSKLSGKLCFKKESNTVPVDVPYVPNIVNKTRKNGNKNVNSSVTLVKKSSSKESSEDNSEDSSEDNIKVIKEGKVLLKNESEEISKFSKELLGHLEKNGINVISRSLFDFCMKEAINTNFPKDEFGVGLLCDKLNENGFKIHSGKVAFKEDDGSEDFFLPKLGDKAVFRYSNPNGQLIMSDGNGTLELPGVEGYAGDIVAFGIVDISKRGLNGGSKLPENDMVWIVRSRKGLAIRDSWNRCVALDLKSAKKGTLKLADSNDWKQLQHISSKYNNNTPEIVINPLFENLLYKS